MSIQWREMPDDVLEAHFNPRVASADAEGSLARYAARSAQARATLARTCHAEEDVRYGTAPKQTLDLYRPLDVGAGRPLVVFIHGGYWRALDKSDHSFVVPPMIEAGAVVANLNYDLCPDVTLDEMCDQVVAGVRYCHAHAAAWGGDPGRLILIGHSAGAHLAARVINAPADAGGRPPDLVAGVVAISGIYEPQVVLRLPTVNEQAQITADAAERNDCLAIAPAGSACFAVCAGGDEPEGWTDQSRRYADLVRGRGLECTFFEIAGTDHFTVLERAFETGSEGWQAILGMLGKG
jgi:arylformamidase